MNLNTFLLGAMALAVIIVAGVWLNDRFNPKTAEEIWLEQQESAADVRALKYKLRKEHCAAIVDSTQRVMEGCD